MIVATVEGLEALQKDLRRMMARHTAIFKRSLDEIGLVIQRQAVLNAPKSPTKGQYLKALNIERFMRQFQGKRSRKNKSTSKRTDFNPGGLERSIRTESSVFNGAVDVYVPVNSEAGQYGHKMHEDSYNLGIGSLQKASGGNNVGRKYIERAANDKSRDVFEILRSFVDDMIDKENAR